MGLILLIVLIVLLLGAAPAWPYSRGWGYGPFGLLGLLLVVLLVLVLLGHVPASWGQEADTVAVVAAEEPGLVDQITDDLVDLVIIVVGGALTWLAAMAVRLARQWIGTLAADKLASALDRAVAVGQAAAGNTVRAGADYLKEQLPDTIRTLKMSDAQVTGLVHAKLTEDAKTAAAAPPTEAGRSP